MILRYVIQLFAQSTAPDRFKKGIPFELGSLEAY